MPNTRSPATALKTRRRPEYADNSPGVAAGCKSNRTRDEILAAAARLFRARGVDGARLRRIASEARLEPGSIYYHFESKEAILDAVLDRGLRDIHEGVGRVLSERGAAEAGFRGLFAAVVHTHLHHLHSRGDFTSTNIRNFSQLSLEVRRRHAPLRRDYARMWDAMLSAAQERGEISASATPALMRRFVLGALNWTVEWFDPSRASLSELTARITELVLDGISSDEWREAPVDAPFPRPRSCPETEALSKVGRTREAILRSAARLLRDRGYTAATLRAIAVAADLKAGSIYYHFGSKTEILDEVLDRGLRGMRNDLEGLTAEPFLDHRARLATAIGAHLGHLLAAGEFTSANIRNYGRLPADVRRRHRPVRAEYAALWERLLAEARDAGVTRPAIDVPLHRRLILGALNWTVEWYNDAPRADFVSAAEYTDFCVRLILDGIASPSA